MNFTSAFADNEIYILSQTFGRAGKDIQPNKQIDRQTDKQADRQTGRQTDRQEDRITNSIVGRHFWAEQCRFQEFGAKTETNAKTMLYK